MIIAIGDIHGNIKGVINRIKEYDLSDCSLIQVGDFGMGFGSWASQHWELKGLNKVLQSRNINLWAIRGNHDNPVFWSAHRQSRFNYSNITWAGSYSHQLIDGKMVSFVGGAISIDRKERVHGKSYFPGEQVTDFRTNPNIQLPDQPIDILITHDVSHYRTDPRFVSHKFETSDLSLIKDLQVTQEILDDWYLKITDHNKIYNKAGISWYHGHYHRYYCYRNTYGDVIVGCGIDEFVEIK